MDTAKPSLASKLQDYQLEEWARCSYKFYYSQIKNEHRDVLNWRQMVQYSVNHVIHDCYSMPAEQRTPEQIQRIIAKRWRIRPTLFDSQLHEVQLRQTMTEQLIRYFAYHPNASPLLFLFESYSVWVEELGMELSMIFQIAEWSQHSFVIRKLFVDSDMDVINCFHQLAALFCYKAFGRLPERIAAHCLSTGQIFEYRPTDEQDISKAIEYVRTMNESIHHSMYSPKIDSQTECHSCPFQTKCTALSHSRRASHGITIRVS